MLTIEKVFLQGFKSFCDPTEIVFDEEGITAVVGPNGCGKCLDGATLVTLSDGRDIPIRDLVDSALQHAKDVEQLDDGSLTRENPHGIEILSLNPVTLRLEPRPVSAFIKRTTTPTLLRVRTHSGREIIATPYHPLFTLENGRLRVLNAEELQVGVRLALPRMLPAKGSVVAMHTFSLLAQFHQADNLFIPYSNPNLDLIPGVTSIVKEAVRASGFKIKRHRQAYPKLAAYVEERCEASRGGVLEAVRIIEQFGERPNLAREHLKLLSTLATSDIYWDEIVSVEQVKPQDDWVYDLSIAETHNFVAGNVIVHNSNIADAVSWVIGEQRAKALRGGKMEDVIFQGSRNRPPSGMAEVILNMVVHETFEIRGEVHQSGQPETEALRQAEELLDQAEAAVELSAAPAEVPAETPAGDDPQKTRRPRKYSNKAAPRVFHEGDLISVGRRLFRTGESEYEMNGRACRLRDIQDLFSGTGLGGAHYAIIEQGRIGQVLSAKPLDRRALIEEAAGVSKFKMRQHAAELKLEASKQNLSRVSDILAEIERQQNSLKRQAARARRYQRLRQEMRDLMRAVYVVDYRTTRETIGSVESALGEITSREREITASIAGLDEAQTISALHEREAEETLNETRQLAAGIDLDTERARQQHTYLNQQLQAIGSRSEQFSRDQAAIEERRTVIELEKGRLREELQLLEHEINAESKSLTEDEDQHRALIESDAQSDRELEEARKKVYERVTHLERWRQLKRQFTDSVDRSRSRLQELAAERERALSQEQAAREQHVELMASLDVSSNNQERISAALSEMSAELERKRRTREERQDDLSSLQRDLTATEHRLKSLNELDQRRAYFTEAVQALMTRDPQANSFRTLGTLSDFVSVAPEHEAMIETALREELQYVVVPTFDDALGAIDLLKTEGAGRATFLVVGLHGEESSGTSPDGDGHLPHHTLDALLKLRPEFAEAFKLALPGLAMARIVEDRGQAISASLSSNGLSQNGSIPPATILSHTGERVVAGRLISGGSSSEKGAGVLALKREIIELNDRLGGLAVSAATAQSSLSDLKLEIAGLEESHRRLDDELRQVDKELAVQREQLQQCERESERAATHIRVVEREIAQAEEEGRDFEARLEHAGSQTEEAERSRVEAERIVEIAQTEINELRRRAEERSQELSRRRAGFAAKTERRRGLQNDIRRLEGEGGDLDDRLNRSRLEVIEAGDHATSMQETVQNLGQRLEQLISRQQALASELEERNLELGSARERVQSIEGDLRASREAYAQAREERAQKEIERARLTSDLDHLIQSCRAELSENIVEVCERLEAGRLSDENIWDVPEDFDLEPARARLEELRSKIESLGPVNMMALEELTEVEERFTFLSTQKADIEKAIADTQSAIAEIKRRSRERFQEAFQAINENFKQMFQELFGGGHGEMRLIDESDILESGIEIIAQPPGKRLQNILLLSGGEKAMAALSLVLAIFRYRPSPFCLLDEVDAPLDEVNIGRFVEKVVEMSAGTQFVIITHSKRTMEAAQTLYGVTMEDPGVSKLISVKLT
jgi:chromosome segregation protein